MTISSSAERARKEGRFLWRPSKTRKPWLLQKRNPSWFITRSLLKTPRKAERHHLMAAVCRKWSINRIALLADDS